MKSRLTGRKRNVILAGCVAFFAFWPDTAPGAWPQFRGDPRHTAAADLPANIVLVPRWSTRFPSAQRDGRTWPPAVASSPCIADGLVYAGSRNGRFYALDALNGEVRWEYDAVSGIESSPMVRNGRVFVATSDGRLLAFDAGSGALMWTHATGGGADRASPNASNDNIIGAAAYPARYVYAVPAASPDPATAVWRFETAQYVASSPAVDPSTGDVFCGCNDGRLYALKSDGTPLWPAPFATVGGVGRFSPTVGEGRVLFCGGDYDWRLHAVDAVTGTEAWSASVEPQPVLPSWQYRGIQVSSPARDGAFVAMVAGYGQAGYGPSTLYAWRDDTTSATRLWSLDIPNSMAEGFVSSPAVTPHHVIVGCAASYAVTPPYGRVYVVARADGTAVWYGLPGPALSSPAVSDGAVFIGDQAGCVTRLDALPAADLDNDGLVTVLDALRIARVYGAGTPDQVAVADLAPAGTPRSDGSRSFGDGLLTPADTERALSFAVGLLPRLP